MAEDLLAENRTDMPAPASPAPVAPASEGHAPHHVFLVDGSGFIFRAFHALPPMSRPDGTPVNAVFGYCNMLMRLMADTDADRIAVVFDASERTFRNEIYPEYKAHRPPPPEELVPQFGLIREATRAFGVPCIEMHGYEADDIIASYARHAAALGAKVTIVSSDKDLMQLVNDRVELYDPIKLKPIGAAEVMEKFGVAPAQVVEVQALAGDSVDNVPGVPGIGVKTAASLLAEYGSLDALLDRAAEIKQPKRRESLIQYAEQARISRRLVQLVDDVTLPEPLDALGVRQPDPDVLLPFLRDQGFRSMLARVEAMLGKVAQAKAADMAPAALAGPVSRDGYALVTDEAALAEWVDRATAAGIVAFDTETTGLDPQRAELVGFSLAVGPGEACYVPLAHRHPESQGDLMEAPPEPIRQIALEPALALLKPLLTDPAVLKVAHNAKYDMAILDRLGLKVEPLDDTMLLSYVLDGSKHGHGMDELSRLHLDHVTISYEDVCGKGKSACTFDLVPLDRALAYAAEDADVTLRLHCILRQRLLAERMVGVYETLERPLVPVLHDMEARGVRVDPGWLRALSEDFGARLAQLEQEIHGLAGRPFNIGSPKQLGEILFEEMGLTGGTKAKTGAWGTGADVLEDLAAQGHALPARVLDWRQLAKLKSTYADALVGEINPRTGRVHTCFAMSVTSTGRLSSSDPNLQNIPIRTEEGRKIRHAFVASPGTVLMSADYSQIELRLLAHVADIEVLKEAFRKGLDIHAMTASQVFGVPIEGMDPMIRRQAKAINFGIIYGISAFGLGRQLGIPQADARRTIEAYFVQFPGIRDYMERAKSFARQHGFVTTIFGRKCWAPGIADKNPARRSFAERAAINAPLQGSAADVIKRAMIRIPDALAARGLGARMLLQVHDELLFEVPEGELAETGETVKQVMEAAAHLSVPLTVEVGHGTNWAEAH